MLALYHGAATVAMRKARREVCTAFCRVAARAPAYPRGDVSVHFRALIALHISLNPLKNGRIAYPNEHNSSPN